jgi:hypothetical protein
MARSHLSADPLLELLEGPVAWHVCEEGAVKIQGCEAAGATNDDLVILKFPLEDGARTKPQAATNLRGNRDLPLRSDP